MLSLLVLVQLRPQIRHVWTFFIFWILAWLFEYYFLGQNSYIHMDDEGDHFVPYYLYLINQHLGGQFGHGLSGGNDVYSAFSPGFQLISPELYWLSLFPVWIAVLLHKAILVCVGFLGSYVLVRYTSGASRLTCAAVAAIFTVSTHNLVYITYSIGAALSFLPLAIHVLVARSNGPRYWLYAIPTIIVTAIYLDPTHVIEPMFAGIGLAALMLKRINLRVVFALAGLFVATVLNWGEPIYAMLQMSSLTERGGNIDTRAITMETILENVRWLFIRLEENRITLLALLAVVVLWFRQDELRVRATVGIVGVFALYVFLVLFPFREIGLPALSKLSHHYVLLALTGVMLPAVARAADHMTLPEKWGFGNNRDIGGIFLLALSIGMLVHFKTYNFANLLYHGGQSQYHSIETLKSDTWRPKQPFRVVTLRVRDLGPEPGIAYGLYDLESLDVYMMLETRQRSLFYKTGILRRQSTNLSTDPRLMIDWSRWRDGFYHGIGEQASLDLLRLANVGFILTPLPLAPGDGLRLVAGPDVPPMTREVRASRPLDYIRDRINRLFDFPDLYIYELPEAYPQVFAAKRIASVSDNTKDVDFLKKMERQAGLPLRGILTRKSDRAKLGESVSSLRVEKYAQVANGFTADLSAPEGGILVVNTVKTPFWHATADGDPLEIVPVNMIQMAVRVPKGSRSIKFDYRRPSLFRDH